MRTTILLSTLLIFSCGNGQTEKKATTNSDTKENTEESITINEDSIDSVGKIVNMIPANFEKIILSSCTILDVRTPSEVAEGIIPEAVIINFQDADFAEQIQTLDKTKPVCVYCKVGGRSSKAADMLSQLGYNVFNLEGGMDAWKAEGKAIVKK